MHMFNIVIGSIEIPRHIFSANQRQNHWQVGFVCSIFPPLVLTGCIRLPSIAIGLFDWLNALDSRFLFVIKYVIDLTEKKDECIARKPMDHQGKSYS